MHTDRRFDLYAPIHKAIRLFMTDTLTALGRLDLDDAESREATLDQLDSLLTAAGWHLHHENEMVHPVLEQCSTGLSHRIVAEHDEHLEAIAALRAALAALRADPQALRAHRLYRQFAVFVSENLAHMEYEETHHNRALWEACDDGALQALEGRILASIGPQEMALWMRWMIPALSPAERAQLLSGMPPAVRVPLLSAARGWLDDGAWAQLCRALGQAPVPGLVAA